LLYFVRHASTELNAGDPADPRDMFRGWTQAPLSDFGRKTTRQTAAWFRNRPVDAIISSDLPRAAETAQQIGQMVGIQPTFDPRLRPWHIGQLTGQLITPKLKEYVNDLQTKRQNEPVPGGEAYNDFLQRYGSALPEILQAAQQQNIVMVAHHRNSLSLAQLLYGKPTQTQGPPDPGGIALITPRGVQPVFTPPAVLAGQYKERASS